MDGKQSSTNKTDYKIRKATLDDLDILLSFVEDGADEAEIHGYTEESITSILKETIIKGIAFVLVVEEKVVGVVCGVIKKSGYIKVLITAAFYIEPRYRSQNAIRMLLKYKDEAKRKKVDRVQMHSRFSKDPIKMTLFYERFGFEAREITYELEV